MGPTATASYEIYPQMALTTPASSEYHQQMVSSHIFLLKIVASRLLLLLMTPNLQVFGHFMPVYVNLT